MERVYLLLFFNIIVIHAILSPFTKVEESFNVQAVFDFLNSTSLIPSQGEIQSNFDHIQFPGVVPRTFWGAFILSFFVRPFLLLFPFPPSGLVTLLVVRISLSTFYMLALHRFVKAIRLVFGPRVSEWFLLLSLSQFHLPFYASRLLPNTFATILVMWSQAELLLNRPWFATSLLIVCTVVFRCDMVLLLAPTAVSVWLWSDYKGLFQLVSIGVRFLCFGLMCGALSWFLTRTLDAHMWLQQEPWYWFPEGQVLYFNTVLNKSSDYGVSPFYWYFTVALPKALLASFLLLPIGAMCTRTPIPRALAPSVMFVCLYSLLPHKEVRFLFPVLPMFTLAASVGADFLWTRKSKVVCVLLVLMVVAGLGVSLFFSAFLARNNYPGAQALVWLQTHRVPPATIHIDAHAAINGISRFVQSSSWEISKREDVVDFHEFDYLVSGQREIPGFSLLYAARGEPRLQFSKFTFPTLKLTDSVFVLENNKVAVS